MVFTCPGQLVSSLEGKIWTDQRLALMNLGSFAVKFLVEGFICLKYFPKLSVLSRGLEELFANVLFSLSHLVKCIDTV